VSDHKTGNYSSADGAKPNTKTSFIIRSCLAPPGLFVSPPSMHLQWGCAGRVDFFVSIVKRGIEITRDGNRLFEHAARSTGSGAYGVWLKSQDMKDYILLDCRTGIHIHV